VTTRADFKATGNEPGGKARVVLVVYATRDGHSRLIVARLVERMAAYGSAPGRMIWRSDRRRGADLAGPPLVALAAAVRYGRHLPQAARFLAGC
jgi:menaquinone-dependent protoporphyrinogen IX oxidase